MNQPNNNMNNYDIIDPLADIPEDIRYQLDCRINQSIVLAEEYLIKNRPIELLNNIINIDGQNIDMFDYLIVNDNLKEYEFALVALSGDHEWWIARKTPSQLVQYYNFTIEDKFATNDFFGLFTKNYKQRTKP